MTVFDCADPYTLEDYFGAHRGGLTPRLLVAFDRLEDFKSFNSDSMRKAAHFSAQFDHLRPNGRTAIVVPGDMEEILVKLYSTISADVLRRNIEFRIFQNRSDAMAWLLES